MSLIKQLIYKEWSRSFLGAALVLFVIITAADLIDGLLRDSVTFWSVCLNYIVALPDHLMKIFPVSCLMASIFSVNKLKNRSELTAIFASGFSRKQFLMTIGQCACIVAFAQFLLGGHIGPFLKRHRHDLVPNAEKFKNLKSKGLSASTISSGKIWFKGDQYYFAFSSFDKNKNVLHDVVLYYFDENFKFSSKILANKLTYQGDGFWEVDKGKLYGNMNGANFPTEQNLLHNNIQLNEDTEDFKQIEADITILNFFALRLYVSKLKQAGINTNEYEVILYDIVASSLICIIFALLASSGIDLPNRRASSFGKNIIFVFVFSILYWLVYSYLLELGRSSKMWALAACFTLPLIFIIYLYANYQKASGPS